MSSRFSPPSLQRGDVVFMDNLRTHKIDGIAAAIEAVGVKLRYLPTYSPDLNPIEMAVSKLKTALRKGVAHTVKALTKLIGKLIIWGGRSLAAGAPRRKALTHCGHRRVTEPYRMQYEL